MKEKNALEEIPENQYFLLEILNKKPGWFIQYGGYAAVALVALLLLLVFFVSQKNNVILYNATLMPAESNRYQVAGATGIVQKVWAKNGTLVKKNQTILTINLITPGKNFSPGTDSSAYLNTVYSIASNDGRVYFIKQMDPGIMVNISEIYALIKPDEKKYRGAFEILPAQAEKINIGDTLSIDVSKYSKKIRFVTGRVTFKPAKVTGSGKKIVEFEFTDDGSVFKDLIFDELKVTARFSGKIF
jgi:hypothetical protein